MTVGLVVSSIRVLCSGVVVFITSGLVIPDVVEYESISVVVELEDIPSITVELVVSSIRVLCSEVVVEILE